MTGYQAYLIYLALKRHFSDDGYDVVRYNWKIAGSLDSFDRRRDKHYFNVLAKKPDPKGYIIANFLETLDIWLGDLANSYESNEFYTEWNKKQQSLTRVFTEDINKLDDSFKENFDVKNQLPLVLRMYRRKQLSHETLVILNSILSLVKRYDKEIDDTIVWPDVRRKIVKYSSLLTFDKKKFTKILRDRFTD